MRFSIYANKIDRFKSPDFVHWHEWLPPSDQSILENELRDLTQPIPEDTCGICGKSEDTCPCYRHKEVLP